MVDLWRLKTYGRFFTFHSGYIPIFPNSNYSLYRLSFTFHSGYIPMRCRMKSLSPIFSLHSILDIFQWVFIHCYFSLVITLHSILDIFQYKNILPGWLFIQLYIPFWIYSNPNIWKVCRSYFVSLHSILDIFQLYRQRFSCNWSSCLYIPFWIYSNFNGATFDNRLISLYIPPLCQVLDTYFILSNTPSSLSSLPIFHFFNYLVDHIFIQYVKVNRQLCYDIF